jgi:UDP-glucose 4-epimerase
MPAPPKDGARVAVTGGAGFIGSHTVELLLAANAKVLVIDDHSHPCGESLPAEIEFATVDCGSRAAARALKKFQPEVVLHLAYKGGVQQAARDPGSHVKRSLASSVALFQAAINAGARRLVIASTGGSIYGEGSRLPSREVYKPLPLSAFGAAKRAEEVYVAALGLRHGISTLALRYGDVYGPRQDGTGETGVIAITCHRLLEGGTPLIFGDGGQTRDFIYVTDIAAANVLAVFGTHSGEVNVGTGREISINAIVKRLVAAADRQAVSEHSPARQFEVRRECLNSTRAHRMLRWKSRVSINAGLGKTWSWFHDRHEAKSSGTLAVPSRPSP